MSASVFLLSNILASKGVQIGPLVLDAAFFLFPVSYIIGDLISEVYGFRAARRTVLTGFGIMVFAVICFYIGIALPAADFYPNNAEFALILGLVPRIVAASLAGYALGQLLNAWALVKIKARTGERSLWARLVGSTVVGQFGDTLVFCTIAAPAIGITNAGDFANYVIVGFLWKTLLEAMLLPATYGVVAAVKKHERY
nr:queuosine precursor transporter [Corynebacterium uterequi]